MPAWLLSQQDKDATGGRYPCRVALVTALRNEAKHSVTLIEIHIFDSWVTQSSVSLPSQSSGMAA